MCRNLSAIAALEPPVNPTRLDRKVRLVLTPFQSAGVAQRIDGPGDRLSPRQPLQRVYPPLSVSTCRPIVSVSRCYFKHRFGTSGQTRTRSLRDRTRKMRCPAEGKDLGGDFCPRNGMMFNEVLALPSSADLANLTPLARTLCLPRFRLLAVFLPLVRKPAPSRCQRQQVSSAADYAELIELKQRDRKL